MIKSRCYSDDLGIEVNFDATPWFESASDEKIVALINCNFGGDYGADTVAEDLADRNPEIKKMFDYIGIIRESQAKKGVGGFECHVDAAQALAWVNRYRPHIDIAGPLEEESMFVCKSCKSVVDIEGADARWKSGDNTCPGCV